MSKPTKEDAQLLLRLMEVFRTPEMEEALRWFAAEFEADDYEDFVTQHPIDSEEYAHVSRILATFETAGALVSQGVLSEDLYFDTSGIGFLWPKLEKIIPGWQQEVGPALWENAVWLAERQKQWAKEVWKPDLTWKPDRPGTPRQQQQQQQQTK